MVGRIEAFFKWFGRGRTKGLQATASRWLLLKSPENLKREQRLSLKTLLKINLKTVRAYLLKEELRKLWFHFSLTLAGSFLLDWCRAAKASRIEPLARVARTPAM